MIVEFFVPQAPQGKRTGRAVKIGGFTRIASDPVTRKYEAGIAAIAHQAMQGQPPMTGPVMVDLAISFAVPQSWSQKKRAAALDGAVRPTVKPDCSNVLKAIEDGCNGVVFEDDRQIVHLWVSKYYGEVPGVAVTVRPIFTREGDHGN